MECRFASHPYRVTRILKQSDSRFARNVRPGDIIMFTITITEGQPVCIMHVNGRAHTQIAVSTFNRIDRILELEELIRQPDGRYTPRTTFQPVH